MSFQSKFKREREERGTSLGAGARVASCMCLHSCRGFRMKETRCQQDRSKSSVKAGGQLCACPASRWEPVGLRDQGEVSPFATIYIYKEYN